MWRRKQEAPDLKVGIFFLLLMLVGSAWARPGNVPEKPPETVVAIGDVHGDFDDFVAILQRTGLINQQNHWTGGKTTFVQCGDLLDRGPKPREVMDLMMALEREAEQAGGRVVGLLGNHEMMNIMGDLRYVTPVNFASYADSNSEKRQKEAYAEFVKWRGNHIALLAELPQPMELTEAEWMARHPAGFIEQREAFGPKGRYGEWLRKHDAVAEVGGSVFLHGGIHPDLKRLKIDAMNDQIHDEIKTLDASNQYLQGEQLILPFFTYQETNNVLQAQILAEQKSRMAVNKYRQAKVLEFLQRDSWLSVRPDGPLWFRGYDQWSEADGAPQVDTLLQAFKVTRIVVGHTVQKGGRIRVRFGGKIFLIDTGMLSSYYPGGRASALEICGDAKIAAVYLDRQVVLFGPGGSRPSNDQAADTEKLGVIPVQDFCSVSANASQ
jgi:hypothetical protein